MTPGGAVALADACPLCSGLTHEAHRKEVEQVYLRCSAGSVEWMYPTGALIVNVRPNTFPPSRHLTLCIKPLKDSSGANIYLEKTGELKLLVRDGDRGPGQVRCFGFEQGGLFVEAAPQQDISRRTTGFQYELTSRHAESDLHALSGGWRAPGWGAAAGTVGVGCTQWSVGTSTPWTGRRPGSWCSCAGSAGPGFWRRFVGACHQGDPTWSGDTSKLPGAGLWARSPAGTHLQAP